MTPKVSVIVPFYNSEKTLSACLESIREQTLEDMEVILVDDGSTDNGLEIARRFSTSYSGSCVVLSQKNSGPAAARNRGIAVAKGEFIAFVDSDDVIDPTMYEKMFASACKHNSDIVSCGRVLVDSSTGDVIKSKVPGYEVLQGPVSQCPSIVKRVGPLMCDKMFRRAIVEENGICFDEDIWYAEDFLFGTRVKLYACSVSAVREPLYRYTQGEEGSLTGGSSHVMDIPKAASRVLSLYDEKNLLEVVRDPLLYVLAGYYIRRCKTLPSDSLLWRDYKREFKALFGRFFGPRWVFAVGMRILGESEGLRKLSLLLKAVV